MKNPLTFALTTFLFAGLAVAQEGRPEGKPSREAEKPAAKPADKPQDQAKEKAATLKVGDKLPANLKLRDLDGKEIATDSFKDKVVCLVFWSIECPIMVANEHKFIALHKEMADKKDVVLLAVNSNVRELGPMPEAAAKEAAAAKDAKETYSKIRSYMKDKGMSFRVVADHGNVLADMLDAKTTPHSYVFDKGGVLRYAGGYDDDMKASKEKPVSYTKDAIEACLAGKEPKVSTTNPWGCTIKRAGGGRGKS
jgi:hypothetical protein